jgi:hypothetical protein
MPLRGTLATLGAAILLAGCSTPPTAAPQMNPKSAVAGYLAPGAVEPTASSLTRRQATRPPIRLPSRNVAFAPV